jgi:hypothetical protein
MPMPGDEARKLLMDLAAALDDERATVGGEDDADSAAGALLRDLFDNYLESRSNSLERARAHLDRLRAIKI